MIEDFFKKLLGMPLLELTPSALQDFLALTNRLPSENITVESFNALKNQDTWRVFSLLDLSRSRINYYLACWNNLCIELDTFILILQLAWYELFQKVMGADELQAILVMLMPRDQATLEKLLPILDLAYAIKKNSYDYHVFHFSLLHGAAEHKLSEIKEPKEVVYDDEDEKYMARYTALEKKVNEPAYYNLLYLIAKLKQLCQTRMNGYGQEIIAYLAAHQINDYPLNMNIISPDHYRYAVTDMVLKIMDDKAEKPPHIADSLKTLTGKYVIFLDLFTTLDRLTYHAVTKLTELTQKFSQLQEITKFSFDDIELELTEETRIFLEIPEPKKASLLNLNFFTPPATKISLQTLMRYLTQKLESLFLAQAETQVCTPIDDQSDLKSGHRLTSD